MPLKFMMKMMFVMTIFVGLTNGFAAEGGANGGGGGLINENGKLKTLPEAGIILNKLDNHIPKTYPEYYPIGKGTKDALIKVVNKFPFSDEFNTNLIREVLSQKNIFVKLSAITDTEYQAIRMQYSATLKKHGFNLDESRFSLGAVSKAGKTYILPVFDSLGEEQKALILFHEYFMRDYAKDSNLPTGVFSREELLPLVLYLDGQVYKLLQSTETKVPIKMLDFIQAIDGLKLENASSLRLLKNDSQVILLMEIQKQLGRALRLSDFINKPADFGFIPCHIRFGGIGGGYQGCSTQGYQSLKVDPSLVQMITHDAAMLQYFVENFRLTGVDRDRIVSSEALNFCRENVDFVTDKFKEPGDQLILISYDSHSRETKLLATNCEWSDEPGGVHVEQFLFFK